MSVADTETGIRRDYLVAPVSHFSLTIGYWVTAVLILFFFTICTVLGGELFFLMRYHHALPGTSLFQTAGTVLFSSMINAAILLCLSRRLKSGHIFHPGKPLWHSNRLSRRSLSALFLLSQLAARHAFFTFRQRRRSAAAALYRAFKNPARAASPCGISAGAFAILWHRAPATWLLCGHAAPIWADGVPLFAAHALPLGWRARK